MEFVEYLYEKGILLDFNLANQPYCKFSYDGRVATFWYEKRFTIAGGNTWVLKHTPDFTAMQENEVLAVFDAKNYTKSRITEAQNKMLAYMTNLDINFGALIFPNDPKYWDDFQEREKLQKLSAQYSMNENIKKLATLLWNELPVEYRSLHPPIHMNMFESGKKTRYHLDQTLCLFRMSPTESEYAVSMKKNP